MNLHIFAHLAESPAVSRAETRETLTQGSSLHSLLTEFSEQVTSESMPVASPSHHHHNDTWLLCSYTSSTPPIPLQVRYLYLLRKKWKHSEIMQFSQGQVANK